MAAVLRQCGNRGKEWLESPTMITARKYEVFPILDCRTDHAPTVLVQLAANNSQGLLGALTIEEVITMHLALRETCYRICDELTRESRKIIKTFLVFDLHNARCCARVYTYN
jgi:hypothetical protein